MLQVNYVGLMLRNPIIAASGTPTQNYACLRKAIDGGAGAAVTKSVVMSKQLKEVRNYRPGDRTGFRPRPNTRLVDFDTGYTGGNLGDEGRYFSLLGAAEPYPTPEEFEGYLAEYKAHVSAPIIVSISGGEKNYEEWKQVAKRMEKAGADALELCLHHVPATDRTDPGVVTAVKEAVSLPVIAKTRVATEPPETIGPALQEAGADAIAAISGPTLRGLEVDVAAGSFVPQPVFCGARGPWYRPVGLAYIARLAQCVDIPLSGVAGVVTWKDVVKYILVGATTVQVCSAIFAYGYGVLGSMASGIEQYMKDNHYSRIEDFRGKLLSSLTTVASLQESSCATAIIDAAKCVGCGRCEDTCFHNAISLRGGKAVVDKSACMGCGLCVYRCPVGACALRE